VLVFGLDPSSPLADYLFIQLARFAFETAGLSNTGLLNVDDLRRPRPGDYVVTLADGRDQSPEPGSLLMTDALATILKHWIGAVLPDARGRAETLSLHTATSRLGSLASVPPKHPPVFGA
jgi:hypothetical protein